MHSITYFNIIYFGDLWFIILLTELNIMAESQIYNQNYCLFKQVFTNFGNNFILKQIRWFTISATGIS